jgi:hypothetical protein
MAERTEFHAGEAGVHKRGGNKSLSDLSGRPGYQA